MTKYDYGERKEEYERSIYEALTEIRRAPGAILGRPSLERLTQFLSGYEFAIMNLLGYRPHFDKEFWKFISETMPSAGADHWDCVLRRGRSDEEAFSAFYVYLDRFLTERGFFTGVKTEPGK